MEEKIKKLADWMKESKYTVVMTGAGMSTESGIPDFRSSEGMWKKYDPKKVATSDALYDKYELFHEFYAKRVMELKEYSPHKGHVALSRLEKEGLLEMIVTQNVDGFHQIAGSKNIKELHGNIYTFRCEFCEKEVKMEQFLNKEKCSSCGGTFLRPNVILFGEELPDQALRASEQAMREADLVIVIGTSLRVFPASRLPFLTNGKIVYVNDRKPDIFSVVKIDLFLKGKAGEILEEMLIKLGLN